MGLFAVGSAGVQGMLPESEAIRAGGAILRRKEEIPIFTAHAACQARRDAGRTWPRDSSVSLHQTLLQGRTATFAKGSNAT